MADDDDQNRRVRLIGVYIMLPFILAVSPIVGWWIGSWLDGYFGTTPYLSYGLLLLGIVAGIREFYRIVKNYGDGNGV